GGLEVRARGRRDGAADEAAIEVAIAGAGVDLEAAATLDHEGLARARWRLAIPELSRTAALADRFAEVPPLAGSLRTRGSCAGEGPGGAGTLPIAGFAGAGVGVAEVTATLEGRPLKDAPTARVDLRARDLRAQGFEFADVELHAAIGPSMTEETGPLTVRVD